MLTTYYFLLIHFSCRGSRSVGAQGCLYKALKYGTTPYHFITPSSALGFSPRRVCVWLARRQPRRARLITERRPPISDINRRTAGSQCSPRCDHKLLYSLNSCQELAPTRKFAHRGCFDVAALASRHDFRSPCGIGLADVLTLAIALPESTTPLLRACPRDGDASRVNRVYPPLNRSVSGVLCSVAGIPAADTRRRVSPISGALI